MKTCIVVTIVEYMQDALNGYPHGVEDNQLRQVKTVIYGENMFFVADMGICEKPILVANNLFYGIGKAHRPVSSAARSAYSACRRQDDPSTPTLPNNDTASR